LSPHAPAPTAHSVFLLFLTIFCPPFLVIRFGTCHLCLSHSEYQKIVGGCLRAFEHVTLVKCIIRAVQFYFSSFIILILMYCTRVLYDLTMCCRSGCCFVVRWRHRCLCRRCSLLVAVVARRSSLVARCSSARGPLLVVVVVHLGHRTPSRAWTTAPSPLTTHHGRRRKVTQSGHQHNNHTVCWQHEQHGHDVRGRQVYPRCTGSCSRLSH